MPRTHILASIALVNTGAWLMVTGCELAFPTHAESGQDAATDGMASDDATGRGDAEDAANAPDGATEAHDASPDTTADSMSSGDVLVDVAQGDSQEASSGPTLVQQVAGAVNDAGTITIWLDASITAGDTLVLLTSSRDVPVVSVSGGGVQTWSALACGGPHSILCSSYGSSVGGDGGVAVTLQPATEALAYNLSEWRSVSGIVPSSINDDYPSNGQSATMVDSPPIDASAGQLVVVAIDTDQAISVTGFGGGFTALTQSTVPSVNGGTQLWPAYLVAPSAGTFAATWVLTPSDGWDGIGMAFQP